MKRTSDLAVSDVQRGNRVWWSAHPMSYDWHSDISVRPLSREWFDDIDARFVNAARLFATDQHPFDRIIPYDSLKNKRVLEIGCGMGLHTELMARAGANVTAIDLSQTSVAATEQRLALKEVRATVLQADAERLPFSDASFDFVWSWGVIHHSSRTVRVVREIARVLRRDGEVRVMVYNRLGMAARVMFWRDHVIRGGMFRRSFEETLYRSSDGFSARFYVPEQFEDIFRGFFREVGSAICGQESDAIPLPRSMRKLIVRMTPEATLRKLQSRRGAFILLTARGVE